MTEIKPARMFAATQKAKPGWTLVYISWRAREVRQELGAILDTEDWRKGWKRALRDGWRVIPVTVTPEVKR